MQLWSHFLFPKDLHLPHKMKAQFPRVGLKALPFAHPLQLHLQHCSNEISPRQVTAPFDGRGTLGEQSACACWLPSHVSHADRKDPPLPLIPTSGSSLPTGTEAEWSGTLTRVASAMPSVHLKMVHGPWVWPNSSFRLGGGSPRGRGPYAFDTLDQKGQVQ